MKFHRLMLLVVFCALAIAVFAQPPAITAGKKTIKLTVTAEGAQPMTFQWLKNDKPIAGATSSVLEITDPRATGYFSCVVKNEYGSITTDRVQLANTTVGTAAVKITRRQ